jgi:hypothetical protein
MWNEQREIVFKYASDGRRTSHYSPDVIGRFIRSLIEQKALGIGAHLHAFKLLEPFFLIAGTGLGKTVILPLHLWRLLMEHPYFAAIASPSGIVCESESPRVWVVEPKIAIAQGLEATLNDAWRSFSKDGAASAVFGCKTRVDHKNVRAPIVFITTGIFAIYARKGMFRPGRDAILIDEAHTTLEADESVELGVALCRHERLPVSYMSATVDPAGLSDKLGVNVIDVPGIRFPVWKHNMCQTLDDCIVDLVEKTIVRTNISDDVFPRRNTELGRAVINAVTQQGRAKGMLIIVNSFSSETSDARRVERLLENAPFADQIKVGLLASEVLRHPGRRHDFECALSAWERERKRYVLIATSVVEMGVTLPSIDFVVTMDSGFGERDDGRPLSLEPLGTNALIQRIGRVGRLRPGIAYITRDIGAPYSDLHDTELNTAGTLRPEPIRFPLETGDATQLAYLSYERPDFDIASLSLPSGFADRPECVRAYLDKRDSLKRLGIAEGRALTPLGVRMERWIGRMDLDCAVDADRSVAECDPYGLMCALCRGVLRIIAPDTLWNASSPAMTALFADVSENEEKFRRMLEHVAVLFLQARGESWIERFRFAEEALSLFYDLEIHETRFFQAISLYTEFCDVLFAVLGGEEALDARSFRPFLKTREGLVSLLRLQSDHL